MSALPVRDRRLIGTWRSDRRETFRHWLFAESLPVETRTRFKRIFGNLMHTYTPSRMIVELRGEGRVYRYEVLGKDRSSVAIRSWERDVAEGEITHVHFIGAHATGSLPLPGSGSSSGACPARRACRRGPRDRTENARPASQAAQPHAGVRVVMDRFRPTIRMRANRRARWVRATPDVSELHGCGDRARLIRPF